MVEYLREFATKGKLFKALNQENQEKNFVMLSFKKRLNLKTSNNKGVQFSLKRIYCCWRCRSGSNEQERCVRFKIYRRLSRNMTARGSH